MHSGMLHVVSRSKIMSHYCLSSKYLRAGYYLFFNMEKKL